MLRPAFAIAAVLLLAAGCTKPAPVTQTFPPAAPPAPKPVTAATVRHAPPPAAASAPEPPGQACSKVLKAPLLVSAKYTHLLELSPDGKAIAVYGVVAGANGVAGDRLVVFDAETGKPAGPPLADAGQLIAGGTRVGRAEPRLAKGMVVTVRDVATGKAAHEFESPSSFSEPRFAPHGATLAFVRDKTRLVVAAVADGTPVSPPADLGAEITTLSNIYLGGTRIAAGLRGGAVAVYDVQTGRPVARFDTRLETIVTLKAASDGSLLLALGPRGWYQAWDPAAGTLLDAESSNRYGTHPLPGRRFMVPADRWEPSGAGATFELKTIRYVKVVDAATKRVVARLDLPAAADGPECIAASADGRRVAAITADCRVYLWDLPAPE